MGGTPLYGLQGLVARQGMVFGISFLNMVNNFTLVSPKQGMKLSLTGYDCTIVVIKYGLYSI